MPPQIEKIVPFDENENKNIEQSLSEYPSSNVLNIRKYLLTLIFVQWVSSNKPPDLFYHKNEYVYLACICYYSRCRYLFNNNG